jgi:carbamoyl-phosphate synthase large subunit
MTCHTKREQPFTILISSAGRRVSLMRSFREALDVTDIHGRVVAADLTEMTPAMQLADERFIVPRCTDPSFVESATELCLKEGIDLVVPTIDTELPAWSAMAASLAGTGTTVAVSSPTAIAVAADKRATNAHCVAHGIPVPRQSTLAAVNASRSEWAFPFVLKPSMGSASNGLQIVNSWREFDRVLDGGLDQDLIVEAFLSGTEHTVDVFVDRSGRVHSPVVRRRLEVRAGEVSKARVVRDDFLASLAVKTIETLPGAYGILNVQLFSDGTTAGVVEINARFGGGYPLTWRAGGRYSEWLIREVAFGEKVGPAATIEYDLAMLRWDEEVFARA